MRAISTASFEVGRDRLLAVDVLAGARAPWRAASGRICVVPASKKTVSSLFGERGVEVGAPAGDAVGLRERLDLLGVAADQDRVGHHPVAVGERDAALRADGADRADQVLVHPHPAGDAVHDETESSSRHVRAFVKEEVARGQRERFADAAQVAGRERRGAGAVGDVVEGLDADGRRRSRGACSAAKIGAKRISPWPGARRFGSLTWTWRDQAGRQPACRSARAPTAASLAPAALQSIIVRSDGRSISRTISAASATVLIERRLARRERLDAVDDAVRLRRPRRAAARKSRSRPRAVACVSPGGDRALLRRAVHEDACRRARRRGRSGASRRRACARGRAASGSVSEKPGRLDQQPVQAGDDEARTTRPTPRMRRASAASICSGASASVNGAISRPS